MIHPRPRVVLDTHVLISSLWDGLPGRLIHLWQGGKIHVLLSAPILEEYLAVLARFDPGEEELDRFAALLGQSHLTEWVSPQEKVSAVVEDPSDNRFLECAVMGKANALVSGDRHLLKLKQFEKIPILSPRTFLSRWKAVLP